MINKKIYLKHINFLNLLFTHKEFSKPPLVEDILVFLAHLFPVDINLFISRPESKFPLSLNGSCNFLMAVKFVYLILANSTSMALLTLRTFYKCLSQTLKSFFKWPLTSVTYLFLEMI